MSSRSRAQQWPFPRRRYFEHDLRKAASAWFAEQGCATHPQRSYCLKSRDDWPHNIILDEVAAYIARVKHASEEAGKPFPLHKYVHHGLSSQAMVFNLVGPLITRDDYVSMCGRNWAIDMRPKGATESMTLARGGER
jgi:hypothetical protein